MRRLRVLGYDGPEHGKTHMRMVHPATGRKISIPMHGNRDIGVGLIRAIMRQAGITRETWNSL